MKGRIVMLILMSNIFQGPAMQDIPEVVEESRRKVKSAIVLKVSNRFELLFGRRALQSHFGISIECEVLSSVNKQRRKELILAEMYDSGAIPTLQLAEDFLQLLKDSPGVTLTDLAGRIFMSTGTAYFFKRLVEKLAPDLKDMLTEKKITQEVVSTLCVLDYSQQRETVQYFIDGTLKNAQAGEFVQFIKKNPYDSVEILVKRFIEGLDPPKKNSLTYGEWEPPIVNESYDNSDTGKVSTEILELAGKLDIMDMNVSKIPEFQRSMIISRLKILASRASALQETLERYLPIHA